MLSKSQIKYIASLQQKKYRQQHGEFVVEGKKLVEEVLASSMQVSSVYVTHTMADQVRAPKSVVISEKESARISGLKKSPGVLAIVKVPTQKPKHSLQGLELFLENLSDPGNMGTLIRTAEWFGLKRLWVAPQTVEVYNPKVVQSAMGSLFRMPIHTLTIEEMRQKANEEGAELWAADMQGTDYRTFKPEKPIVLVVGNEANGLSPEALQLCHRAVTIPKKGQAESLNAAMAAGILLSHFS